MRNQIKLTYPIQDLYHTEQMAYELFEAIENETLNVLWLRPRACAILLHKAMSGLPLSILEHSIITCLHKSIKRNIQSTSRFIESWIIPFFYETLNEQEECNDYS